MGVYIKILALDIETRPATVYTWSLYQPIIGLDQVIDPGGMMCYAAKWVGKRGIEFKSTFHHSRDEMLRSLWDSLNECDAVLHFNGDSFDIPHIQREFMEVGMTPPAPYKSIDLFKTVKRQARFLSNKLAHVAPQLGLEGKIDTGGFKLWRRCLDGERQAWNLMRRYNIRDVKELEEAYEILKPWIPSHPSHAALASTSVCPRCGSDKLENRGFAVLTTGRYQRLHCLGCGAWSRQTQRVDKTEVVAL